MNIYIYNMNFAHVGPKDLSIQHPPKQNLRLAIMSLSWLAPILDCKTPHLKWLSHVRTRIFDA